MTVSRLPFLVAALALAACETTPEVTTDADPTVDFTRYRTYAWVYDDVPSGMNPLNYERIHDAIDSQLAAQGFMEGEPADFAVAFTVGARDKVEVDDFGPYGSYYGYGWGYGWGPGYSDVYVRNVREGTLVIDVYDVETKKPIWHGAATEEIGSGGATQEEIDKAVASVLTEFPPGASAGSGG
jgi:hypothetical protein